MPPPRLYDEQSRDGLSWPGRKIGWQTPGYGTLATRFLSCRRIPRIARNSPARIPQALQGSLARRTGAGPPVGGRPAPMRTARTSWALLSLRKHAWVGRAGELV